jgi:hypothetical protein
MDNLALSTFVCLLETSSLAAYTLQFFVFMCQFLKLLKYKLIGLRSCLS